MSSVVRQKGKSQKGVSRKQSTPKFPKNKHFLPSDTYEYLCVPGGKKCLFFGNFGVFCFLETLVLGFALLPYYRRSEVDKKNILDHLIYQKTKLLGLTL